MLMDYLMDSITMCDMCLYHNRNVLNVRFVVCVQCTVNSLKCHNESSTEIMTKQAQLHSIQWPIQMISFKIFK